MAGGNRSRRSGGESRGGGGSGKKTRTRAEQRYRTLQSERRGALMRGATQQADRIGRQISRMERRRGR